MVDRRPSGVLNHRKKKKSERVGYRLDENEACVCRLDHIFSKRLILEPQSPLSIEILFVGRPNEDCSRSLIT